MAANRHRGQRHLLETANQLLIHARERTIIRCCRAYRRRLRRPAVQTRNRITITSAPLHNMSCTTPSMAAQTGCPPPRQHTVGFNDPIGHHTESMGLPKYTEKSVTSHKHGSCATLTSSIHHAHVRNLCNTCHDARRVGIAHPENMLSRAAASSSRHQAARAGHENVCCCHSAAQAVRSGGTQARPAFSFMSVCTCCLYTPGSPRRARRKGRCCGQLVRLESRDQLRHTPPAAAPPAST